MRPKSTVMTFVGLGVGRPFSKYSLHRDVIRPKITTGDEETYIVPW
jgi:hypothetical protein